MSSEETEDSEKKKIEKNDSIYPDSLEPVSENESFEYESFFLGTTSSRTHETGLP